MCDLHGFDSQADLPSIKLGSKERRLSLQGLDCVLACPELAKAVALGYIATAVTLKPISVHK